MDKISEKATIGPGDNGANAPSQDYKAQTSPAFTPEQLENGRKWVDALRSGRYRQGQGYLRSGDDQYCCLGVACDLLGLKWTPNCAYAPEYFLVGATGEMQWLPAEAVAQLGLPPSDYKHFENQEACWIVHGGILATANDAGKSFAEIADLIEQHIYLGMLPASGTDRLSTIDSDSCLTASPDVKANNKDGEEIGDN